MKLDNKIEHRRINNVDLNVYTYYQNLSDTTHVTIDDYLSLLSEQLSKPDMNFNYCSYQYVDSDERVQYEFIEDISKINSLLSEYIWRVETYFCDNDNTYNLRYSPFEGEKIELIVSKKKALEEAKKK